ncbi:hypothetical protein CsatB_004136 [Cannabis sativa]
MHPDKSPGPDGMTPGFYQKYWDVVGVDVISQVVDFFETCSFPADLNRTNIVLIPKKKHVTTMSELRPISLCNVAYKVVSKVLANRLKPLLPCVISENQSAFIAGRLISDNIMIAFEVMHYLKRKRKGKTGFMALKLDLSKAYDRIEWGFLKAMMLRMGFHPRWVDLMMATVMNVKYTVVHGGRSMGPITPTRGIRQGDPLSPYLFLLCAEGFSSLIKQFERNGELKGCKVANGAPTISHMLFADDSYIYCRATEEEAQNVLRLLNLFEAASGQRVNYAKSSIFFSANTPMDLRDRLCNRLGMVAADENSFYLGLPCIMGRKKTAILGFLKEKMEKRILSWEGKFLSKAGREVLLKTVAQALPSYAMSVFLIPLETCGALEKLMAKYWWGNSKKARGRWSADMESNLWRSLWKLKVPPKVIHFAWKAITGCLPTRSQLYTKHVPVQLNCVCCNVEEESIYHVLVSCVFARSVWNLSCVPTGAFVASDFGTWVEKIVNNGQTVVLEEAIMVSWAVWKARNELLWNKNVTTAVEVINSARTVLNQWKSAAANRFSPLPAVINDTSNLSNNWTPPAAGFLKVNTDGALFSASNSFGLGGLARDANGQFIEAFCLHKPGCVQPSLVEAFGVKEALSWIKTKGWEHVILETDSLVVVQALQSNVAMQSLFGSTITYCRNLLKSLPFVNVCFVKRSANNAAHCLARGACFWSDCNFVDSNVPDVINNAVMADLAILS